MYKVQSRVKYKYVSIRYTNIVNACCERDNMWQGSSMEIVYLCCNTNLCLSAKFVLFLLLSYLTTKTSISELRICPERVSLWSRPRMHIGNIWLREMRNFSQQRSEQHELIYLWATRIDTYYLWGELLYIYNCDYICLRIYIISIKNSKKGYILLRHTSIDTQFTYMFYDAVNGSSVQGEKKVKFKIRMN